MLSPSTSTSSQAVGGAVVQQVAQTLNQFHYRLALIIGIGRYRDSEDPQRSLHNLEAATPDAHGMLKKLTEQAGFSAAPDNSVLILNPTRNELLAGIYEFQSRIEKIRSASKTCLAVIYYAGHGMMSACREHWLLAKDYKRLDHLQDSETASLNMYGVMLERDVLGSIRQATAALVLIDACRSTSQHVKQSTTMADERPRSASPPRVGNFQQSESHQKINKENLLLCYACQAGSVARDSCAFTAAIFEVLFDGPEKMSVFNSMLKVRQQVREGTDSQQDPEVVSWFRPCLFDFFLVHGTSNAHHENTQINRFLSKIQDPTVPPLDRIAAAQQLRRITSPILRESASWVQSIIDCGGAHWLQKIVRDEAKTAAPQLRCCACGIAQHIVAAGYTRQLMDADVPAAVLCAFMEGSDVELCKGAFGVLQDMLQTQVVLEWLARKETLEPFIDNIAAGVKRLDTAVMMQSVMQYAMQSLQLLQHVIQDRSLYFTVQRSLQGKRDVLRDITSGISALGSHLNSDGVGSMLLEVSAVVRLLANLSS